MMPIARRSTDRGPDFKRVGAHDGGRALRQAARRMEPARPLTEALTARAVRPRLMRLGSGVGARGDGREADPGAAPTRSGAPIVRSGRIWGRPATPRWGRGDANRGSRS